ncbi:hypothetical protein VTN96DRAFT_7004 [Rasamsonia emersonii]|uniref:von Willebrand domain-containing protein n=1 Tax=Rasamsonia emersonii (strain ATCC 16479 / CBS 393.64 / IMI 116815) TaxID=1408163 RepID=A0A0F4Z1E0_RASE3|nr:von Willebrand domain-containing protein [Rasamsonia emersonii CBS 393.64]KKA24324.1 von Willebrand domain-containing protein [Rasamsonia emersonii CBS 393.64]
MASYVNLPPCGCSYLHENRWGYLPQVDLDVHATILSSTSRTKLSQTFVNPRSDAIREVSYTFPMYDGVSVVGFRCRIGDRILDGVVKDKEQAKADFDEAVRRGQGAGLLEQSVDASDVFRTKLGNVPANGRVTVEIVYVGELKQDAQTNGVRYVLPTVVAPRYGYQSDSSFGSNASTGGIKITLDVSVEKGSVIRALQSPSHPYQMLLGRTSTMPEGSFEPHHASATTSIRGDVLLERDFVMLVNAEGQDTPVAFLETHPTLPHQRALMASLLPKFSLPNNTPEIVFIIDRSGSMADRIETLKSALRVFLKSLPVGVMFNICSFGSHFSFLWSRSKSYNASSLEEALRHVDTIDADMGGTEMYPAVEATVANRLKDMELEVLLLTDGAIWEQKALFSFINRAVSENPIRFFSLGIGDAASQALIEGIARAGNGFSQSVLEDEELDKKVVRMLKGALTPHINDYTIEFEYSQEEQDDFEIIEQANTIPSVELPFRGKDAVEDKPEDKGKQPISLFDSAYKEPELETAAPAPGDRFKNLPPVKPPQLLQVPTKISLYPLFRSTMYILLSPKAHEKPPQTLLVRGTSKYGPLELRIPIQDVGTGETIHQLAARRALVELEERRGWISNARVGDGRLIKDVYDSKWEDIVAREGTRLGTRFQVAGEWTSFVAVERDSEGNIIGEGTIAEEKPAGPGWGDVRHCSFSSSPPFSRGGRSLSGATASAQPAAFFGGPPMARRMMHRTAGSRHASVTPYRPPATRGGFGQLTRSIPHEARGGTRPRDRLSRGLESFSPAKSEKNTAPSKQTKLNDIITLQTFEGSWEWTQDLLHTINLDPDDVAKKVQEAFDVAARRKGITQPINPFDSRNSKAVLATTLTLIFLEKTAADLKDTWELIGDKARSWISSTLASMDEGFRTAFDDAKAAFENFFF